jgi:hypothetical protein
MKRFSVLFAALVIAITLADSAYASWHGHHGSFGRTGLHRGR